MSVAGVTKIEKSNTPIAKNLILDHNSNMQPFNNIILFNEKFTTMKNRNLFGINTSKAVIYLSLLLAGLMILPSCEKIEGEGPVVSEIRNRTGFEGLKVSICGQVNFQVANQYKVELFAQRDVLEVLQTKVDDDILEIKWSKPVNIRNCNDIVLNIAGPDLKSIFTSGSSDIDVSGPVVESTLELGISGSGSIEIDYAEITNAIDVRVSGSGNVDIEGGKTKQSEIFLSGSGNIELAKFKMDNADCNISGSGNITVNVANFLDAHISGSGDIYYYGSPKIESKISGSGKLRQL